MTDLARLARGVLHCPESAPASVAFAADELATYLGRMFGSAPVRRTHAGPHGTWLCLAPTGAPLPTTALTPPANAEYEVRPANDVAVLTGATPRALLAAVYALLAGAGCRWSPLGLAEERVPGPAEARRELAPLAGRAAFARRTYAADLLTWHYTMPTRLAERLPGDVAFVDWMAKSGATGFFFIRHANDTEWVVPALVDELTRRGLDVEGGGHAMSELLPRELFAEHPEYFPLGPGGQRSDCGNLCVSSLAALAIVRARARAARARIPGATGLHLWGLDLLGGGWCLCAGCARLTPSDQALRLCNEVAEEVDGCVFHLAYHDTLPPPRTVRPEARLWAEFAPRERCYAHPLDERSCARNAPYRESLERHLELFEGRVQVFEYYGDAILFGGCAVPLVGVIAQDLDYYARVGVPGVSCLTFGRYSLWAYGVNVEAFARGVLQPADALGAPAAVARGRYGTAAAPMLSYFTALERLMGEVVTYGDLPLPPRAEASTVRTTLSRALARAPELRRLLAEASTAAPERLFGEAPLLDYTLAMLAALEQWLTAVLAADSAAASRAVGTLTAAIEHVQAVDPGITGTWGAYDLELAHSFFAAALSVHAD